MTKCKENISRRGLKNAFILTYDRMRRYEGTWHLEQKLLFPECVILESEDEETLAEELAYCGYLNKEAGQKECLIRVGQKPEEFLKRLCGEKCHLEMSRGIISKGVAQITEGPLRGMERLIRRIDRHRRLARVEIMRKPDDWNRHGGFVEPERKLKREYRYIPAGLEITEKTV